MKILLEILFQWLERGVEDEVFHSNGKGEEIKDLSGEIA